MKKVIKKKNIDFSEGDIKVEYQLETWRKNALNALLIVILGLFTPTIIIWVLRFNNLKDVLKVGWVYMAVYVITTVITVFQRIDYRIRAWIIVSLTFFTGLQAMILGGLAGDGRVYLMTLPILTLILISAKAGAVMSGLALSTYIFVGIQTSSSPLQNKFIIYSNPLDIGTWIQEGIVLFACMLTVVVLQWKFNQYLESIALKNANLNEQNQKLVDELECRVKDRTVELQKTNETLKIREKNLTATNIEAERANNAKSEFLSRMSHELRAPLNLILGFAQLLELDQQELLKPQQLKSVKHIISEGDSLLKMIDEVLDIEQIESGHMKIKLQNLDINQLLVDLISTVKPSATHNNIEIKFVPIDNKQIYVLADRQRLHQVLLNLILNAVKYNRKDGMVNIFCEIVDGKKLRINIKDSGPGIPLEKLSMLFKPFVRLDIVNENVEGAGLGLALSKKFIELMDGNIGVESNLGEGSKFWIEIPTSESKEIFKVEEKLTNNEIIRPPKCTILYIEDNQKNIDMLTQSVKDYPQVNLIGAIDGFDGLKKASRKPNLILLDFNLPDMNGYDVLKKLKENETTRNIPVIIISADATKRKIEFMIEAGALDYLTKPINIKEFLGSIEIWLP